MNAKVHYDDHLGNYYSWMIGDFDEAVKKQVEFFRKHNILPGMSACAVDLGAGNGIQTAALARLGFNVKSVDFNRQLLEELRERTKKLSVEVFDDDIRNINNYKKYDPELIVCCGDTLTHLESKAEVAGLIKNTSGILKTGARLILTFRNYTNELKDENRFIPVKSDDSRIAACFLEYSPEHVQVMDILYEKAASGWTLKTGSYRKVRLEPEFIKDLLEECSFRTSLFEIKNGMITIIAVRL